MHPALQSEEVLGALKGALGSMKALFDDSVALRDRYLSQSTINGPQTTLVANNGLLNAAAVVAEAASSQSEHLQRGFSSGQRIRWVLKDKASTGFSTTSDF